MTKKSFSFLLCYYRIVMFNIKNNIDFFLRKNIKISRKNYSEINEIKDELEFSKEELILESELIHKYKLEKYKNNSTVINYCQNLYLISILNKYFDIKSKPDLTILDIGSKNWFYAPAEYYYFKRYCKNIFLDGVEIDAYRLYANFYNRLEVAKFYIKDLPNTNYIPDDLMNINKSYDYIVWILPFVLRHPLRAWGLPDNLFKPQKLFEHAYSLLKQNGKMLIINQTKEEFEAQIKIINGLTSTSTKLESPFYEYKYQRFLTIVEK